MNAKVGYWKRWLIAQGGVINEQYPAGKKLSVIAKTFFDYLKEEAIVIHNELVSQGHPHAKQGGGRRPAANMSREPHVV